jgi:hypothetical protein
MATKSSLSRYALLIFMIDDAQSVCAARTSAVVTGVGIADGAM